MGSGTAVLRDFQMFDSMRSFLLGALQVQGFRDGVCAMHMVSGYTYLNVHCV